MEKNKFLAIYEREQRRLNYFDTERKAKIWQAKDNKVDSEYSLVTKLLYSVKALELAYNNCGADNLDFEDQLEMEEFIRAIKLAVGNYVSVSEGQIRYSENDFEFSVEVLEEIITLAYLYMGMQVSQYPAFNRIVRKNYITNFMLYSEDSPETIRIMNFSKTFAILSKLEPYNRVKARYEKELSKIGRNHLYIDNVNFANPNEYIKGLKNRVKRIQYNFSNEISKLFSKHFSEDLLSSLDSYICCLSDVLNHPEDRDLFILEMMIEIANILCDIPVQNIYAFQVLVDNNYIEQHMIMEHDVIVKDFEEVYSILEGYKKIL